MDVREGSQTLRHSNRSAADELRCVRVRHPQGLLTAFRLIHARYVGDGLMRPNRLGVRILPHQLLETTSVLLVRRYGEVMGTLSVICEGELGLPIESIYAKELARLRRGGRRVAELSSLATNPNAGGKGIVVLRALLNSALRVAADERLDAFAICVHPRHMPFYQRRLGFEVIGGSRSCSWVCGRPAVAMSLNVAEAIATARNSAKLRSRSGLSIEWDTDGTGSRAYLQRFLAEASPFPLPNRRRAVA